MQFRVSYYPEHRPQKRWLLDADLMRLTRLSLVQCAGRFPARIRQSLAGPITAAPLRI